MTSRSNASDNTAALDVLRNAVNRCADEDMRTAETFEALTFLQEQAVRKGFARQFRAALELADPGERQQQARTALQGLARQFGGEH